MTTTLWYLATPFSKYPHGTHAAYVLACEEYARLIAAGVPVFCPIAMNGGEHINLPMPLYTSHEFWMNVDRPFMEVCTGIIVLLADGWQESRGMQEEIEHFAKAGKPGLHMIPGTVPAELLAVPHDYAI